jgi:hypothetical protein
MATRYTVVADASDRRTVPTGIAMLKPAGRALVLAAYPPDAGLVPNVALAVDIAANSVAGTVEPAGLSAIVAVTSQSPAESEIEVMFVGVLVVRETADPTRTVELTYCPIWPAAALSFVAVPVFAVVKTCAAVW